MAKRKFTKEQRRWLKKAGFGREFGELGGLACALHEAQTGLRPAGYDVTPDLEHGRRTRRRVRRARWRRFWSGLFFWRAAGPSSRKRRTLFRYAEAPALRNYAPAVLVVVVIGVLAWLLCG